MSIKFDLQTSFLIFLILYVKIEFTIYICCCALKYVFKYVLTVKDMSIYRFEAKKCMWVEAHLSQKRIEEIIYLDLPKDFLTQTVSLVSFVLFVSFFSVFLQLRFKRISYSIFFGRDFQNVPSNY